ncbi:unnamed protein product [Cylicocyclus nassatus]|uniref:Carbohydrate kinase PfkB domain-containing protein n=1 Tax=Cylicocyclus nassatus TaxID=53992 RepID=A0AA36MDS9_CYLNA|nr:unnamed protein product [Cylicocyclus nassatus]
MYKLSLICRRLHSLPRNFIISPDVKAALAAKKGVVALESTVITHGLPYPQNLETAKSLEEVVRNGGCEPATIALLDGNVHVGLTSAELSRVADSMESVKVSRRDIPFALSKGMVGGTTVAATMYLAHMAGIEVFATGGVGGVHRGAEQTFDISADLIELSKTPVTVVCAGVKSILDIPKTVEFLETHSVNCIVYGPRNVFPGFFTQETTRKGQFNTMELEEVVQIIETSKAFGLSAGTLLACPIPKEFQANGNVIEEAVQKALKEASEKGIQSKDVTPFILAYVNKVTSGATMETNIALLKNNAKIAAQLASILAKSKKNNGQIKAESTPENNKAPRKRPKIAVIGATIVDFESITDQQVKNDGASYVGEVMQRCGGVGRNHADALARLGCDVTFISTIGNDDNGKYFMDHCPHIDKSRVEVMEDLPTAVYMSVNVRGEVRFGISAIGDIINRITPEVIMRNEDVISAADYVLFDGNISTEAMGKAVDLISYYKRKAWFEPTDLFKARKIFDCRGIDKIHYISPNANEFRQIVEKTGLSIEDGILSSPGRVCEFICSNPRVMHNLDVMIVTLSSHGVSVVLRDPIGSLISKTCPPPLTKEKIVSVSGAGDSLNCGFLAGLAHGFEIEKCMKIANKCAALTLQTTDAVSTNISPILLDV